LIFVSEARNVPGVAEFSFLTNHAYALVCVAREPGMRLRDIADCIGITERAAHRIVCQLEEAGYLRRHRMGRRNFYEVDPKLPLPDKLERDVSVGDLLRLMLRGMREAA
jgi:DNA-binding IclR family transcriptional regulator